MRIEGPVFPVVTPFVDDVHRHYPVDIKSLRGYVDYLLHNQAFNIMVASATSRFAQLSEEEIRLVNSIVVDTVGDRGLAIASTGIMGTTAQHIETAQYAESIGARVIACEYPWRFQSIEGLVMYYQSIVEHTEKIKVMIHVTPGRSELGGLFRFDAESLQQICAIPRVVAMKEASGDKNISRSIWKELSDECSIIVAGRGCETYLDAYSFGVSGFFTGSGNIIPKYTLDAYQSIQDGQFEAAKKNVDLHETLFLDKAKSFGWHAALKSGLHEMGLMSITERPPMQPLTDAKRNVLKKIMVSLGWI